MFHEKPHPVEPLCLRDPVKKSEKSSRKVLTRPAIRVGSSPPHESSGARDESRSRPQKGPIGFLVPSNGDLSQAWPGNDAPEFTKEALSFSSGFRARIKPGEEEKAKLCAACFQRKHAASGRSPCGVGGRTVSI
jgi:hypothetical protein